MTDVAKQSGKKTTLKNLNDGCCQISGRNQWKENHFKILR